MNKDEALKLALEALELANYKVADYCNGYTIEEVDDAITAIKQALAAPDLQAELDATNRQVEILSDALAKSRREIDAMVALARADEREACLSVIKPNATPMEIADAIRARSCPPCNEDCDQGRNCPARGKT